MKLSISNRNRTRFATEGLVHYADASVKGSYVGTGNVWNTYGTDRTGVLNGCIYDSTLRPSILFDGINDTCVFAPNVFLTNNFTYEFWVEIVGGTITLHPQTATGIYVTGNKILLAENSGGDNNAGLGVSVGTNGVVILQHGSNLYSSLATLNLKAKLPFHLAVVVSNKVPSIYIDGVLFKIGIATPRTNLISYFSSIGNGSYGYANAKVYVARAYNRALTASEVRLNYSKGFNKYKVPVSLLLNGEGSNGSTVITDSSDYNHTVTRLNNVISTAQSKFGGSSILFTSNSYLQFSNVASLDLIENDFTVEAWIYPTTVEGMTQEQRLFGFGTNSASAWSVNGGLHWLVQITHTKYLQWQEYRGGTNAAGYTFTSTPFTDNQWFHVCICRKGNKIYLGLNGTVMSFTSAGVRNNATAPYLRIGRTPLDPTNELQFQGYMDDIRVVKGVALYTSNYTPPTAQLTVNI